MLSACSPFEKNQPIKGQVSASMPEDFNLTYLRFLVSFVLCLDCFFLRHEGSESHACPLLQCLAYYCYCYCCSPLNLVLVLVLLLLQQHHNIHHYSSGTQRASPSRPLPPSLPQSSLPPYIHTPSLLLSDGLAAHHPSLPSLSRCALPPSSVLSPSFMFSHLVLRVCLAAPVLKEGGREGGRGWTDELIC